MKISLLKLVVFWRRVRHGGPERLEPGERDHRQLERLMRRANPFASWGERANWLIDITDWLRRGLQAGRMKDDSWLRARQRRVGFLLDYLDTHRDVRRVVRTTVQKTLREAIGPELFCDTGLPQETGMFRAFGERVRKVLLPDSSLQPDLSALFIAMFPSHADADWLMALDHRTVNRLMRLCADDGIVHGYRKQVDEALVYLASMVVSAGISPDFRQRLEPGMPLQATPFMSLRREIEKFVLLPVGDEASLRGVRMLIAVCQAQTDRIYAHLDEHGVSIGLVQRVERMRAQLHRMGRLVDLRSAPAEQPGTTGIQALLIELVQAHHAHALSRGVVSRSFALLARKMVERHAAHANLYAAHDRAEYSGMFKSAWRGGLLASVAALGRQTWHGGARFFDGTLAAAGFAMNFAAISAVGGSLAGQLPAVATPTLAAHLRSLDTIAAMRRLLAECAAILRGQAAAVIGNLAGVVPVVLAISFLLKALTGQSMLSPIDAHATLSGLSTLGATVVGAGVTGVMLWFSGIIGGFADNWFALRKMKDAVAHHRHLVRTLGAPRAQRWAGAMERHVAALAGTLSLALMFGLTPVLARFFGLPFDVRHVTLAAGQLTSAAASIGWHVGLLPDFWLACANLFLAGALNIGVALLCALLLGMHAREVPVRVRRVVFAALVRRVVFSPHTYLIPAAAVGGTVRSRTSRMAGVIVAKGSAAAGSREVGEVTEATKATEALETTETISADAATDVAEASPVTSAGEENRKNRVG
jgi:site-specific recombinase